MRSERRKLDHALVDMHSKILLNDLEISDGYENVRYSKVTNLDYDGITGFEPKI